MKVGYYWVLMNGYEKPNVAYYNGYDWRVFGRAPHNLKVMRELEGRIISEIEEPDAY